MLPNEWPTAFYLIMMLLGPEHPMAGAPIPLSVALPDPDDPEAEGFLVVFSGRELADEFLASPGFDMPATVAEVSVERLTYVLDIHVEANQVTQVLVDPTPVHMWHTGSEQGLIVPAKALADLHREMLS